MSVIRFLIADSGFLGSWYYQVYTYFVHFRTFMTKIRLYLECSNHVIIARFYVERRPLIITAKMLILWLLAFWNDFLFHEFSAEFFFAIRGFMSKSNYIFINEFFSIKENSNRGRVFGTRSNHSISKNTSFFDLATLSCRKFLIRTRTRYSCSTWVYWILINTGNGSILD